MVKKLTFRAALIMMCVIAFSVCMDSCEESGVDNHDDENSFCLIIDTNGVKLSVAPFMDWGANLADVEKYVAKYYPGFEVLNEGKLEYDDGNNTWDLSYVKDNMILRFYFKQETGNDLLMSEFGFRTPIDLKSVQDEMERLGLNYKGVLFFEEISDYLNYLYLSSDENLEVQLAVKNDDIDEDEYDWYVNFQPTDERDFDHLIDESSPLCINYSDTLDNFAIVPVIDWDAKLADIKKFMSENYPDWEAEFENELKLYDGSEDTIQHWYAKYSKDSLETFFYFHDVEGQEYCSVQYVYISSTDITQLKREMSRNGLQYIGHDPKTIEGNLSNYVFVPLNKNFVVAIANWDDYDGCWTLEVYQYDENYISTLIK